MTQQEENCQPIYRYKFSDEFIEEMYKFSKIHQYDDRKSFKEAWNIWTEDVDELISNEIRRLNKLGYEGDIIDKMFKSARYYFRKKNTEKKEPKTRREYVCIDKDFLEIIDQHIINNSFKPSEGFDDFCKNNIDILQKEVNNLYKNYITDKNEIKFKIKKTYKNRYFLHFKK
jgi:hypothetical protein